MRHTFRDSFYCLQLNTEVAISTANYPTSTSYIDVSGYRRFGFLIGVGALDSAMTFQVKQDTSATETASIKNITGATVTTGTSGAGGDNYTYFIECDASALDENNAFRYVTLAASGASGNDYASIFFLAWNGTEVPVSQAATFLAADNVVVTN